MEALIYLAGSTAMFFIGWVIGYSIGFSGSVDRKVADIDRAYNEGFQKGVMAERLESDVSTGDAPLIMN